MEPEFIDIELSKPVTINGVELSKIRMREPIVADQLAVTETKLSPTMQEITMIANLCDITPENIKSFTSRDYKKAQKAFLDLTE